MSQISFLPDSNSQLHHGDLLTNFDGGNQLSLFAHVAIWKRTLRLRVNIGPSVDSNLCLTLAAGALSVCVHTRTCLRHTAIKHCVCISGVCTNRDLGCEGVYITIYSGTEVKSYDCHITLYRCRVFDGWLINF